MTCFYTLISLPTRAARLLTLLALLLPLAGWGQSTTVVISQVYGGGGNSGAPFNDDFVELHNISPAAVSVAGWTVQYASTSGSFSVAATLSGSIPAGKYYLIQLGSGGAPGAALPAPDATGGINMSATNGKVTLATDNVTVTGPTASNVVDFVGFGSANQAEGTAAVPGSNTRALFRGPAAGSTYTGCLDTNDNSADFVAAAPAPRNAASAAVTCASVPTLTASPAALAFTASPGQTAPTATYVLTGSGLAANAAVAIASSDPAVLVSLTGAGPFALTATATASAAGTLSQTVTVQFTAPAVAGSTTAIIGNSSGGLSAPVAVTGTAVVPTPTVAGLLLLEEDFDYPAMTTLTTAAPATGWLDAPGTPGTTPRVITTPGNLTRGGYPQGVAAVGEVSSQVPLAGGGGAQDIVKVIGPLPAGTTALYAAALVNVSAAQSGDYFFALNTSMTTLYRARVFSKAVAGGFDFGLSVDGNAAAAVYPGATYAFGTPYLLVVKYENSAATGNTDEASLYVVPAATALAPTTEPATPSVGPLMSAFTDFADLDAVLLRQAGSGYPTLTLDNLRVATGWGAAVGRPTYVSAAPTISAGNYYDVTMSTSGTLTPAGNANVENGLTLTNGLITTAAADRLTLYPAATVSGGGPTSYVNGPVARLTLPGAAPAAVFPIGKGGAYRPATLGTQAQTSTTTYVAELLNTSARTTALDPTSGLTRVSDIRYTTITADAPPTGYIGTVTLAFEPDDYVNYPQDASFVMARRDAGGAWQNIGRTSAVGSSNGGQFVSGSLTSGPIFSFSDFALASTAPMGSNGLSTLNPLPVELTTFTARRTAGGAALAWATASERNSAHFEVERSADGREFAPVGRVAARGSSSAPSRYTYLDEQPTTPPLHHPTYYRLRQVDRDGTAAYSPVLALAGADAPAAPLAAYPNPTTDLLTLRNPAPAGQPARLFDLSGRELGRPELSATGQLSLRGLPAGTYLLRVGSRTLRVVKH